MIKTIMITLSFAVGLYFLAYSIQNVNFWGLKIDCQGKPVSFSVVPECGKGWIEERF